MQLCMQKVLAMAVRTVMMKLMMVLMFSFFIVVMGFDGYTILWWGDGTQSCGGMMVTQSCGGFDGYTIGREGLWRL